MKTPLFSPPSESDLTWITTRQSFLCGLEFPSTRVAWQHTCLGVGDGDGAQRPGRDGQAQSRARALPVRPLFHKHLVISPGLLFPALRHVESKFQGLGKIQKPGLGHEMLPSHRRPLLLYSPSATTVAAGWSKTTRLSGAEESEGHTLSGGRLSRTAPRAEVGGSSQPSLRGRGELASGRRGLPSCYGLGTIQGPSRGAWGGGLQTQTACTLWASRAVRNGLRSVGVRPRDARCGLAEWREGSR